MKRALLLTALMFCLLVLRESIMMKGSFIDKFIFIRA
jgi:hypothetical protein